MKRWGMVDFGYLVGGVIILFILKDFHEKSTFIIFSHLHLHFVILYEGNFPDDIK